MLSISLIPAIVTSATLFAQYSLADHPYYRGDFRDDPLASFIATETPRSLKGILDNIGPNGTQVEGAASGLVIASPSKVDPDCTLPDFHILIALLVKQVCYGCFLLYFICTFFHYILSAHFSTQIAVTSMKMTELTNSRLWHLE